LNILFKDLTHLCEIKDIKDQNYDKK